ncbi:hypothetical protein GQ42DRAFT_164779, partial [Ramicandelaber brevisporus]
QFKEHTSASLEYDRFRLELDIAGKITAESPVDIAFAVRYSVAGNEFWDNNNGHNYHIQVQRS